MARFSRSSKSKLATTHLRLQELFKRVIRGYDCKVLCGYRDRGEQDKAFKSKRSTKSYPQSKHNHLPSIAVDVVPYPIDWDDMERFRHFVGYVEGVASMMGMKIRNGGDWDSDHEFDDQRFIDMPHFEYLGEV